MYKILPPFFNGRATSSRHIIEGLTDLGNITTVYPNGSYSVEYEGYKAWFTANGQLLKAARLAGARSV